MLDIREELLGSRIILKGEKDLNRLEVSLWLENGRI